MIGSVKNLIIIVGCQRSGTTLTGQILGAHENAVMIDEFDGLYPWFHAVVNGSPDVVKTTQSVLVKAMSKYAAPDLKFKQHNGKIELAAHINTLVLKAPNLTYDFKKIAGLEIAVHILYPIRDPRSVVASMLRLSDIPFVDNQIKLIKQRLGISGLFEKDYGILQDTDQPGPVRATMVWKIKSGLAPEYERCGLPVLQFLYEDLIADPAHRIEKMLAFCALPSSELPQNHPKVYQGMGPGGTDRKRAIDNKALNRWTGVLDDSAAADVLRAGQPLAGRFGYV